jgi:uncharacterized membrane protein (UPF0182 family)
MYLALIALLLGVALALVSTGLTRKRRGLVVVGILLGLFGLSFFALLDFWAELLWYRSLGFERRFWTVVLAQLGCGFGGALAGYLITMLLTLPSPRAGRGASIWPGIAGAFLGAVLGLNAWGVVLMFLNQITAGMTEPILGRDVGFYLFSLPFYDLIRRFLSLLAALSLAVALASAFLHLSQAGVEAKVPESKRAYRPIYLPLAVWILTFAWGQYLNRFHLMTSQLGVVAGPGWTDVHVRMPGYTVAAAVALVCAAGLLVPPVRNGLAALVRSLYRSRRPTGRLTHAPELATFIIPPVVLAVAWALALILAPALAQWLRVEPNEITMEREYIGHNISFTRHAFGMSGMQEHEFPVSSALTRETIDANRDLLSEVRLWDWRALADVYEQFQEIRLYYTFPDVDIDRYTIGDEYRQVMISPREMDIGNLPADSQTFVNQRFKYTHGYGLTMSTVSEFTEEGLPNLLIKDIPPKSVHPSLQVDRPQIYYGMLTRTPALVNTKEAEFDYPSGDENAYTRYDGHGGVQLSSLWRKFIYGWKFDGTRFLLSGYPTKESRILFRRQILERVRRIAPFLTFESDPYVVLDQGRLYWIVDAYTSSDRFPYSEPFAPRPDHGFRDLRNSPPIHEEASQLRGANYVRNSVKAVVDAYHGEVSFYLFEPADPIIQVWQRIFPELFKPMEQMPAGLRAHVRYPSTLLLVQGLVYTKYHMTDPAVFYNQEDLWVRATEKYYQRVQPVEPYYVMWKLPGTESPQFVLVLPFTPKNKQVMIGWMAAMCDGDNYGQLLAYKFPKETRLLGPQQVETKIDQDRHLSGQLTLWDQRGSKVIRGNVLAIPIGDTLLYVEPIYLQAETAAYPEIRLVAVMHGDNLSYASTFDEALEGLFDAEGTAAAPAAAGPSDGTDGTRRLIRQANDAFNNYLQLQAEKRFDAAASELSKLQSALEQLSE